jgi:cytidylate kinase, putative
VKITISGQAGSGKTSVSKELSKITGFKMISAGEIFRDMAEEKKMSLEAFSKYAEERPKIDMLIDERQIELSNKFKDCIAEGRLSGWKIEDADLKIWLSAPLKTRLKRIMGREGKGYNAVLKETRGRENDGRMRYKKFYGIDLDDLSIYDLIINTEKWDKRSVTEIILRSLELWNK